MSPRIARRAIALAFVGSLLAHSTSFAQGGPADRVYAGLSWIEGLLSQVLEKLAPLAEIGIQIDGNGIASQIGIQIDGNGIASQIGIQIDGNGGARTTNGPDN